MSHFTSIWGNAVSIGESRPESYGRDITLRYPIYSQFTGDAIRITYDNYCGTEAITITSSKDKSEAVVLSRSLSNSSLIELSFSINKSLLGI